MEQRTKRYNELQEQAKALRLKIDVEGYQGNTLYRLVEVERAIMELERFIFKVEE